MATVHAHAGTVFFDDFRDGDTTDGNPVAWVTNPIGICLDEVYEAGSGDYHFQSSSSDPLRCMYAVAENSELESTSVRTQFSSNTAHIGIQLRANTDDGTGYTGRLTRDSAKLFLFRDDPGVDANFQDFVLLDEAPLPFNPLTLPVDVILQFDAIGSQLSLRAWPANEPMPSEPQLTAYDVTFATGAVGLFALDAGSGHHDTTFRYVHAADASIPPLPADIDMDGTVGFADFVVLSNNFGLTADNIIEPKADIDGDGQVGFADFVILSNSFGAVSNVAFVPEPANLLFWSAAMILTIAWRHPLRLTAATSVRKPSPS